MYDSDHTTTALTPREAAQHVGDYAFAVFASTDGMITTAEAEQIADAVKRAITRKVREILREPHA